MKTSIYQDEEFDAVRQNIERDIKKIATGLSTNLERFARAWLDMGFNSDELILEYYPPYTKIERGHGQTVRVVQYCKIRPLTPGELIPRYALSDSGQWNCG